MVFWKFYIFMFGTCEYVIFYGKNNYVGVVKS